jgi:hypothetical protein
MWGKHDNPSSDAPAHGQEVGDSGVACSEPVFPHKPNPSLGNGYERDNRNSVFGNASERSSSNRDVPPAAKPT